VGDGGNYNGGLWVGPEPFDFEPAGHTGAALAEWQSSTTDAIWLLRPGGAVDVGSVAGYDDLSSRIRGFEWREDADDQVLLLDLENSDGVLDDCGAVGSAYPFLKAGSMLALLHGLNVAGTAYYDSLAWYRIRRLFRQQEGKGQSIVQVQADGYWRMLADWETSRLYQWAAGAATLEAMTAIFLARVGLTYGSVGGLGSAFYTSFQPAIMVQPGASGKAVVQRLVRLGPDLAYFTWGSCYHRSVSRSEAAIYSVGGAGEHPILRGSFQEGGIAGNAFEVYGAAGALGASMEYPDIETGGARRRKVLDGAYATSANAATRAAGDKEKAYQTQAVGWFDCFPIYGLEMWDVLSVTYSVLGITARRYRVCGMREWYDTRGGRYLMRVGVTAME